MEGVYTPNYGTTDPHRQIGNLGGPDGTNPTEV